MVNTKNCFLAFIPHRRPIDYPLHHKLGVVRTLIDRMEKVVDKKVEEDQIRQALKQFGYPDWTVNKVKQDRANNQNRSKTKKSKETSSTRTSVTIPHIQGVTEKIQRIFRAHQVAMAVKPYLSPVA